MFFEYDYVIIGSGPAGSTLAYLLSKKKFKIAIIDRANYKNFKINNYNNPYIAEFSKNYLPLFSNKIGTCIEVGAYDGISGSNSYYFEQKGWNCLCVEPNKEAFDKCQKIRKNSISTKLYIIMADNRNISSLVYFQMRLNPLMVIQLEQI